MPPLCLSLNGSPAVGFRAHASPLWSHLNFIISVKTLFPKKVLHRYRELGLQCIISGDTVQLTTGQERTSHSFVLYSEKVFEEVYHIMST